MTGYRPDAYDRERFGEAQVIEAKCPDWLVIYGPYTRQFWAFGAPHGRPISAHGWNHAGSGVVRVNLWSRTNVPGAPNAWSHCRANWSVGGRRSPSTIDTRDSE